MTQKLNPKTKIPGTNDKTILDYWTWAYSDIMGNTERGVFAEFLVATALGIDNIPRQNWLPYDLLYKKEIRIEIKSSAYLQSWEQEKLSNIIFGIKKSRSWDPNTNKLNDIVQRDSNLYVFCLYAEKEKSKANLLDLDKWEFYILPTKTINEKLQEQQTIGLTKLKSLSEPVPFDKIKEMIDGYKY